MYALCNGVGLPLYSNNSLPINVLCVYYRYVAYCYYVDRDMSSCVYCRDPPRL